MPRPGPRPPGPAGPAKRTRGPEPPPWPGADFQEVIITGFQSALRDERLEVEKLVRQCHENLLSQLQQQPDGFSNADQTVCQGMESSGTETADFDLSATPLWKVAPALAKEQVANKQANQANKPAGSGAVSDSMQVGDLSQPIMPNMAQRLSVATRSTSNIFPEAPPLSRKTMGVVLDTVSGVAILTSVFLMAASTEYNSYDLRHGLAHIVGSGFEGSVPSEEAWPGAGSVFEVLEWGIGFFFLLELALRVVCGIRLREDCMWYIVDFLIIVAWVIERLNAIDVYTSFNPTIVRSVRIVRLVRFVKLVRHVHVFDDLHLIVTAIQSSMSVLMWTVAMLLMLMMVVAMVNTCLLENFIRDPYGDPAARVEVYRSWGSFMRAYVSMFEITLANWGPQCWRLMNLVDERWGFFFITWRCCIGFAVIQVITSVFIQRTFKVASNDAEIMITEKQSASEAYLKHLDNLFSGLDQSGDGQISWEEFEGALGNDKVRHWFGALEIDVSSLQRLFCMLDDGDGLISKEEFMIGLKKIKGGAQSIDLLLLMKQVQRISQHEGVDCSKLFMAG